MLTTGFVTGQRKNCLFIRSILEQKLLKMEGEKTLHCSGRAVWGAGSYPGRQGVELFGGEQLWGRRNPS